MQWARKQQALRAGWSTVLFAALAGFVGGASAQETRAVALELVLAIDCSSSVSAAEFELQRRGLSEAFRHPDVVMALRTLGDHGLAISLVQWSGNRMQRTSVEWTLVNDGYSAAKLASAIGEMERLFTGATGLGGAIRFSLKLLEENRFDGRRKVIDVSGDGYGGLSPKRERDRAVARGITINGLAILNERPELGEYYAAHVIGGTGSFVMSIDDFEDFGIAIRDKLIKEITGLKIAAVKLREFQISHMRS